MKEYIAILGSTSKEEVLEEGLITGEYYSSGGCIFDIQDSQLEILKVINKVVSREVKSYLVRFSAYDSELRKCPCNLKTLCLLEDLPVSRIKSLYAINPNQVLNTDTSKSLTDLLNTLEKKDYILGYEVKVEDIEEGIYDIEIQDSVTGNTVGIAIVTDEIDSVVLQSIRNSEGSEAAEEYQRLDCSWVESLYVDAEVRAGGLGSGILEYIIEKETLKGTRRLCLEAAPLVFDGSIKNVELYNRQQTQLLKFYRKHGFTTSLDTEHLYPEGRRLIIMTREIKVPVKV